MRSWFITGASSGFGRALSQAALARGDAVVGTLRDPTAAHAFEAIAPGRARAVLLDMTDLPACAAAVAAAGAIDLLVCNAGYSLEGVLEATSLDDVRGQIEVHLLAPIQLIRAALPGMRARRSGRILTVGSLAAHLRGGGTAIYAAAKAAIEVLSTNLAAEVAPFGIHVTTVVPGAFRTALGTSRQSAASRIADYAGADAARRDWFERWSGTQRGDPARGAAALLALADMDDPPAVFALGPDAVEGLRSHAAALIEDAERSAPIGGTTDFDAALSG